MTIENFPPRSLAVLGDHFSPLHLARIVLRGNLPSPIAKKRLNFSIRIDPCELCDQSGDATGVGHFEDQLVFAYDQRGACVDLESFFPGIAFP